MKRKILKETNEILKELHRHLFSSWVQRLEHLKKEYI